MRSWNARPGVLPLLGRDEVRFVVALLGSIFLSGCGHSSPVDDSSGDDGGSSSGNAIHVLSNRSDLISGGDALVEVRLPAGAAAAVKMTLNGEDVTRAFA